MASAHATMKSDRASLPFTPSDALRSMIALLAASKVIGHTILVSVPKSNSFSRSLLYVGCWLARFHLCRDLYRRIGRNEYDGNSMHLTDMILFHQACWFIVSVSWNTECVQIIARNWPSWMTWFALLLPNLRQLTVINTNSDDKCLTSLELWRRQSRIPF